MTVVEAVGSEVERAGFGGDAGVEEDVACLGEGRGAAAADGDEGGLEALERGQKMEEFFGLAAVGESDDDVACGEHAEIAVDGFGWVEEVGGRAGGTQGGGDLAGDDAAFADAGEDDAGLLLCGLEQEVDGRGEWSEHGAVEAERELDQCGGFDADEVGGALGVRRAKCLFGHAANHVDASRAAGPDHLRNTVPCIVRTVFASNPDRINSGSLPGRMLSVKRKVLVFGVMVVGISLMLWAGWHNLRERRLAMQEAQESHVVLTPDKPGDTAGALTADDSGVPHMLGKVAPGFTLATLDGKKVSLSDYKGRPVLVNFWATWCAPCKVEMPWFEEFRKQYAAQGFEILGLTDDVDEGKDAIAKVAKKTGVTYPILLTDGKVQKDYGGLDILPMSFYVDKNGVIVEETAGLGQQGRD